MESVAKKFNKYVVVDGTCIRIYNKISKILPLIPSRVVNAKIGMIIITPGTLMAMIKLDFKDLFAKNSNRDRTYAPGAEIKSVPIQAVTAYNNEFPKNFATFCACHALA